MRFLLKTLFVPGTPAFFALVLSVALPWLFWGRTRRRSAVAIAAVFAVYAVLAMPLVADMIAAPLLATPAADGRLLGHDHAAALVMLTGDSPAGRVNETLELFRRIDPAVVILSGSDPWSGAALRASVPSGRLIVLADSRTTRDQALDLRPILAARSIRRVYLVASALHTRRALATFAALQVSVIPIPSPLDYVVRRARGWRVLPQPDALRLTSDALYEYGALIYYRWNRWLPAATPQATTRQTRSPIREGDQAPSRRLRGGQIQGRS